MARPIFNPAGLNRPKLAFSLSRAGFYPRRLRGGGRVSLKLGALLYRVAGSPGRPVVVRRPVPLTAAPAPAVMLH